MKRILGLSLAVVFAIAAIAGPAVAEQGGRSAEADCGKSVSATPPGFVKNGGGIGLTNGSAAPDSVGGQKAAGGLTSQGAFCRCENEPG
jgi:hypothetical protein